MCNPLLLRLSTLALTPLTYLLLNPIPQILLPIPIQFVESRVYEDVVDDSATDAASVAAEAKTDEGAEVSESELVPKVAAAIAEGIKILRTKPKTEGGAASTMGRNCV